MDIKSVECFDGMNIEARVHIDQKCVDLLVNAVAYYISHRKGLTVEEFKYAKDSVIATLLDIDEMMFDLREDINGE